MRNLFQKNLKISVSFVIIVAFFIAIIVMLVIYPKCNPEGLAAPLLGSLIAGLFVAFLQFVIEWEDYREKEKLMKLHLIQIMYNRADARFYSSLIEDSKGEIKVMGVTASRLFNDFCDFDERATPEKKSLIEALARNVNVKVLLPSKDYLPDSKKTKFDEVKEIAKRLSQNYPDHFAIRYFSHTPAHSVFMVDEECIVGPIFPNIESRYSKSLFLKNKSPFAQDYFRYFDEEWSIAQEID